MKGFGLITLMDVIILIVAVIALLPTINSIISESSAYMDSTQIVVAGLIGVFLLFRVISKLWDKDQQYYPAGYG